MSNYKQCIKLYTLCQIINNVLNHKHCINPKQCIK